MLKGVPEHSILRLKEKDAHDVARLEKGCFSTYWDEHQYRELLQPCVDENDTKLPNWVVFGIRDCRSALQAYISLSVSQPDALMEVINIAVSANKRRRGLAWALLRHSMNWGRESGLTRCLLDVREQNKPALGLYAKAGFQEVGRRKKYYADTGEDALVLACQLQQWRIE